MQRIGLPEFPAPRGLPAIARRMSHFHARDRQTVPVKQPLHTRHARLAGDHPSRQFQFPQNEMRRAARILSFHIQDQLLEVFGEHRLRLRSERGRGFKASKDRKSTRLNSSHSQISYAVFCLKKKNNYNICLFHELSYLSQVYSHTLTRFRYSVIERPGYT